MELISFHYGKVALAVRTQYHQLQFMIKVVANSDEMCRSYSDLNFGVTFWNTV